ncbi:MAG: Cyclic di-GMP phosphodiesterase response regulator RpfG, partial [Solirubrobacterales bacterium]|nr:Cyclic di-GMP phosphodiesterase response regulator RpfG [Solirubrobacterales bacterium]
DRRPMPEPRTATPSEAILAVSRLLGASGAGNGPDAVRSALAREARELFAVSGALLLSVDEGQRSLNVLAADPPGPDTQARSGHALATVPAIRDLLELRLTVAHGSLEDTPLAAALGWHAPVPTVLFVPVRDRDRVGHVLALARHHVQPFTRAEQELAIAFAAAASGAMAQVRLTDEQARSTAQQSALARAAKTLNESLDLSQLLTAICGEAQAIVGADSSAIYLGDRETGMVAEAIYDLDRQVLGYRLPRGKGLAGQVAEKGRSVLSNDYQGDFEPPPDSPFHGVLSGIAVPMVWDGALRGVLSVGYRRPHAAGSDEQRLLETFAELAAAACRNANAAAGLALAARTDSLTGCLNHAALQDGLRREIERSTRTAQHLSLVLVDLDEFKQVNEEHGHLVGDEVLRRVGHSLRSSVRPYDICARYGGDEFAIVCADTDEDAASIIAARAIEHLAATLSELEGAESTGATAGIAHWIPGQSATALLEEADRALLFGKQHGRRGDTILSAEIPEDFRPGRFTRAEASEALHETVRTALGPDALHAQRQAERLQKRTRQLVLANALGARLAGMQDAEDIVTAAVDELHRAFGYFLCGVIRLREDGFVEGASLRGAPFIRLGEQSWSQPRHAGVIGRCLRERRVVLINDVRKEPAYQATAETTGTLAELVAPVWVGGRLWGCLNIEEDHLDAFDDDDARLVQMVADQVGAALRSAELYQQLERAYLGTAEALAAALEARDAMAGGQSSSIVGCCERVGERLGMEGDDLRDLRYGAALHDIGKIAVPQAILDKPGPLDPQERAIMERHPLVGEQILGPVEFLTGVAALVRHAHERWDGTGYPDGLAGDAIPLGARIILACDAFSAMTGVRPYRAALPETDAIAELHAHAGTQFDPRVVSALLSVLGSGAEVASAPTEGWQSG